MYTQCEKCKAIFHVNMREVTIAKGLLRCGECNNVFNASKSLSTSMPESFQELVDKKNNSIITTDVHKKIIQPLPTKHTVKTSPTKETSNWSVAVASLLKLLPKSFQARKKKDLDTYKKIPTQTQQEKRYIAPAKLSVKTLSPIEKEKERERQKRKEKERIKERENIRSIIVASLLTLLFTAQLAYNNRHVLLGSPIHEPEKIQMLNHNVFAHPNKSNILLISAQIENTAEKPQPFPVLEISLKDAQSKLVAFRRFLPKEYLTDYSNDQLIPSKQPITLKLQIKDPGNNATRFQFEFL